VEDHRITFELLERHTAQLSPAERRTLRLACPSPHPADGLREMPADAEHGALRYCPKCFVAFTADGRPLNPPSSRP
jgi:hypothetical protein